MNALVQNQGFHQLTVKIFALLDIPSLNNCRLVCTSWVDFIDNDRLLWIQHIKYLEIRGYLRSRYPDVEEVLKYFYTKETATNLKKLFKFLFKYVKNWKNCRLPILLYAIEKQDLEMISIFETSPMDFRVTFGGSTALHYACKAGLTIFLKIYSLSVEKKLDINARDNSGRTLLHWASHFDQPRIIQMLLDVREDFWVQLRTVDNRMNIPMHWACESGNIEVVKYLCEAMSKYGIDINVINHHGYNPLHRACRKGHLEVVKCIVENAAQLDIDLNATTLSSSGLTPLHLASIHGHTDIVSYLMDVSKEKNIDINRGSDLYYYETPFFTACSKGWNTETVELYLKRAEEFDINVRDKCLLHFAVVNGRPEIVKILLKHYVKEGLDLNIKCGGLTAFQIAMDFRYKEVVQEFLSLKIPIEAKRQVLNPMDEEGRTPFLWMCLEKELEIVKQLLLHSEDGIDVMATDDFGYTPIDDPRLATIFFDWYNKSGFTINERGETPFLECCRSGSLELVKMFVKHPTTNLMARDKEGRHALQITETNQDVRGHIYSYINTLFYRNGLYHPFLWNNISLRPEYCDEIIASLIQACLDGSRETALDILSFAKLNGINVNAPDAYGRTYCDAIILSLYEACLDGPTETALDILSFAKLNGINVNVTDVYGRTPFDAIITSLHQACLDGSTKTAFDILSFAQLAEINVNVTDANGRTLFQCAELNRHYDTMEMIYCMSYDMDLDVRPSSWIQHLKHYFQMQFLGNDYS